MDGLTASDRRDGFQVPAASASRNLVGVEPLDDPAKARSVGPELADHRHDDLLFGVLDQLAPIVTHDPPVGHLPARVLASCPLLGHAGSGPLADLVSLHLRRAGHDRQEELPGRARRVDRLPAEVDQVKRDTAALPPLDDAQAVARVPEEPIELERDDGAYGTLGRGFQDPASALTTRQRLPSADSGVDDEFVEIQVPELAVRVDGTPLGIEADAVSGLLFRGDAEIADCWYQVRGNVEASRSGLFVLHLDHTGKPESRRACTPWVPAGYASDPKVALAEGIMNANAHRTMALFRMYAWIAARPFRALAPAAHRQTHLSD